MIYKKRYFRELPCSGKTLLETDQPKIGALLLLPEFQKNASAELHERITRLAQAYSTHSCICFYPDRIGDYVPPLRHLVRSQKIPLKKIAGRVRISAVVV